MSCGPQTSAVVIIVIGFNQRRVFLTTENGLSSQGGYLICSGFRTARGIKRYRWNCRNYSPPFECPRSSAWSVPSGAKTGTSTIRFNFGSGGEGVASTSATTYLGGIPSLPLSNHQAIRASSWRIRSRVNSRVTISSSSLSILIRSSPRRKYLGGLFAL